VRALARLVERRPRWRVTPPARDYLRALAPLHNATWRPTLERPDEVITPDGPRPGAVLMPGMANLFVDTVQVNVLEAAPQINVIPPVARARIDARLLPDTDGDAFLEEVRAILGDEVEVEVLLTFPPLPASPTEGALYRLLQQTLGSEAPVAPYFSPGFTDSHFFRRRGIPAYGFSPFTLEPGDQLGIHAVDERIPVAELDRGIERMRSVVRAWATTAP
jgi:acetylornithine deacetylase/succinyl-diaminopimelate desuccinylase-like protein